MTFIKILQNFVNNDGRLEKDIEPTFGKPFYDKYMQQKIQKEFSVGDKVHVVVSAPHADKDEEVDGIILEIDYDIRLLTSGNKLWKSKKNMKAINYIWIKDIKLIDKNIDQNMPAGVNNIYNNNRKIPDDEYIEYKNRIRPHFQSIYPDVDFDNSHIFSYSCNLYFPFSCDEVTAEVAINIGQKDPIFIPCKSGHICPNKRIFSVYNFKSNIYDECSLYAYLPNGTYEDVLISCLWTINYHYNDEIKQIKVISLDFIDKINSIHDARNIYTISQSVNSNVTFGYDLFRPEYHHLLEDIMSWDVYSIIKPSESISYPIKSSPLYDKYIDFAELICLNYNLENPGLEDPSFGEIFGRHCKSGEYFSNSWYDYGETYDWKMLPEKK